MAETERTPRTGKRYRVANPRGIPEGIAVAQLADGRELAAGDTVTAKDVDSETRQAWLASGILE